jgi:hypothetical protein
MLARLSSFHQQSREAFGCVKSMSALHAPLAGGNQAWAKHHGRTRERVDHTAGGAGVGDRDLVRRGDATSEINGDAALRCSHI